MDIWNHNTFVRVRSVSRSQLVHYIESDSTISFEKPISTSWVPSKMAWAFASSTDGLPRRDREAANIGWPLESLTMALRYQTTFDRGSVQHLYSICRDLLPTASKYSSPLEFVCWFGDLNSTTFLCYVFPCIPRNNLYPIPSICLIWFSRLHIEIYFY